MTPTTAINIELPYHFATRPYQRPFFDAMRKGCKRAVLVWHRRAGKEKTSWNFMIMKAASKIGIYYYFFPHFSQGRKILWDGIDKQGFRFLDHIPKELIEGNPNSTEMKIRLKNGSIIQVIGTNNIDSIVGTNPIGCVFTEYSLQDPTAWQLIRPILRENGGWAVFNFTPRGANHGKEIFDMASYNPDWYSQLLTIADTVDENGNRIITDADIEEERKAGMSEDFIQQEFYCSWTMGIEGAYYAKYMQMARDEERITRLVYDRQARVYTSWDIGYGDSTAIVFYQIRGQEIHIIDYYENHGEGLPHYAKVLQDKPYIYGDHFAPHDIDSHAFSSGLSAREVGASLGIKFIPLPTLKLRIEDGIEALRGIFPRIWIDAEKCKRLIKCLENYQKEFDDINQVYKSRPKHNWSSHGCFVAETLIDTKNGKKKICDIKEGDLVLTPNGYKRVLNTFVYEVSNLLEIMTTSSKFTCTPNHKIFSDEGLIYADAMRYNTTLFNNKRWDRWICRKLYGSTYIQQNTGFRESFLSAKMKHKSSSMDINIDGMGLITEERKQLTTLIPAFIDPCMLSTKEKYQMDGISITKMEIPEITASIILKRLVQASIVRCTIHQKKENDAEKISLLPWSMQKNGIQVRKEENGIDNTPRIQDLEKGINFLKHVFNVILPMKLKTIIRNIVPMPASLNQDMSRELTMKNAIVSFVQRVLQPIGMLSKERVVKIVPLNSPITQKVYDFEVEDDHCYYANGILVSNSDAARYMAIAIKRHVDAGKSGPTDEDVDRWMDKYQPRFEH